MSESPVYEQWFLDKSLYAHVATDGDLYDAVLDHERLKGFDTSRLSSILRISSLDDKQYRNAVMSLFDNRCMVCGYSLFVDIHHVKHKSRGGTDHLSNLAALCANHHKEWHYFENVFFSGVRNMKEINARTSKAMLTEWPIPDFALRHRVAPILIKIAMEAKK